MKRLFSFTTLLLVLIYSCGFSTTNQPAAQPTETSTPQEQPRPRVLISTPMGDMIVELYNETPLHRDNFLKLAEEGFFDNTLFHRVIKDFMIQGGDPNSRGAEPGTPLGTGGPGYTIAAEFVQDYYHQKGSLSSARMGDHVNPAKESSGSQFYIVQGRVFTAEDLDVFEQRSGKAFSNAQRLTYTTIGGTPHLDGEYTVFGRVVQGMEVIDKIAAEQTDRANRPMTDVPMTIKIIK
jgi:cyclophilin family peptidyl-prolyl cis-trans isomerase